MKRTGIEKYSSIIDLPYQKSTRHPQMSMTERAAQFSPYATLTGYDAVISDAREEYRTEDSEYFNEEQIAEQFTGLTEEEP